MISHEKIWDAIDNVARRNGLSASGLAKRAGLDPTAFNKSKRRSPDGRPRWPSMESIAKILSATGDSFDLFADLVAKAGFPSDPLPRQRTVPLLGMAQAGAGGFFDDGGFPHGMGWDEVAFPNTQQDAVYALEVAGESMLPLYRDGDVIIVSPNSNVRRGDRVVVKTNEGEVMAKFLARKTAKTIELGSLNPDHDSRTLAIIDVEWMARIIWASQ